LSKGAKSKDDNSGFPIASGMTNAGGGNDRIDIIKKYRRVRWPGLQQNRM